MKNALLFFALILLSGMCSCGSDDDGNAPLTDEDILASKTWKMTTFRVDLEFTTGNPIFDAVLETMVPDSLSSIDVMEQMQACEQDNTTIFESEGTFTTQDVGLTCSDFEPMQGTWSANVDFTQFSLVLSSFDIPLPENDLLPIDPSLLLAGLLSDMNVDEFDEMKFDLSKGESVTIPDVELPVGAGTSFTTDITITFMGRVGYQSILVYLECS